MNHIFLLFTRHLTFYLPCVPLETVIASSTLFPPSAVTWPEGWVTSVMAYGLGDLHDSPNNSSAKEGATSQELPEWLVRLDQAATLLMTFNTITLMLGMGAATYWKEVTPLSCHDSVPSMTHYLSP